MITKEDVLAFVEARDAGVTAELIARHFQISLEAARKHVFRLHRRKFIQHTGWRNFTLTHAGRQRLAWARDELKGGRIRFV